MMANDYGQVEAKAMGPRPCQDYEKAKSLKDCNELDLRPRNAECETSKSELRIQKEMEAKCELAFPGV
jgi:hypothetical protein